MYLNAPTIASHESWGEIPPTPPFSWGANRNLYGDCSACSFRKKNKKNKKKHPITLVNFSLCAVGSDCAYPAPYLSGVVRVQSNVPIVNFHLFINGTDEGIIPAPTVLTTSVPSGGTLNYGISIKAQPSNPNMPIKAANSYWIMIVANFMDNTESSASTLVIAS